MLNFDIEILCYHCGACAQKCPVDAIQMVSGTDGLQYPRIEKSKCIKCGACQAVCPRLKNPASEIAITERKAYAVKDKACISNVYGSTSGGFFYVLARAIVKQGGFVAGVVWNDNMRAETVITQDYHVIERMRGSKYVWSDTTSVHKEVKKRLDEGKRVLFSGMPCQVASIINYCDNSDRLITCTLFCHGNGSSELLRLYLEELDKKHGSKPIDINFRFHSENNDDGVCIRLKNGKSLVWKKQENTYMRAFFEGYYSSPSCIEGNCQYKGNSICGDMLIGDCWGYQGDILTNRISAVLCNKKGERIVECLVNKDRIDCEELEINTVLKRNPYLLYGRTANPNRERFINEASQNGFSSAYRKYGTLTWYKSLAYKTGISTQLKYIRSVLRKMVEGNNEQKNKT